MGIKENAVAITPKRRLQKAGFTQTMFVTGERRLKTLKKYADIGKVKSPAKTDVNKLLDKYSVIFRKGLFLIFKIFPSAFAVILMDTSMPNVAKNERRKLGEVIT